MHIFSKAQSLVLGTLALAATAIWAVPAQAEEIFPPVIAEDAMMPCVPTCTLCHTTNPGNATSWPGKKFGAFMGLHGAKMGDANSIRTAFAAYKALGTDPTVAAGLENLKKGLDPDNGTSLCGATYGCGAHIAKTPPRSDLSGSLWVVGAMLVGGFLLRRKSAG
jgi:hypothetical protein